jgi:glycosyltransferase involved in cell wall biosynthesis
VEHGENLRVRYCQKLCGDSVAPGLLALLPAYVQEADVIHLTAVYSFPTLPTLLLCKLFGKPLVWSPRGALQRWTGSTRLGLKTVWEMACKLVAPEKSVLHTTSKEEEEESLARFADMETVILPNGIDVPERINHSAPTERLRLLFLGRLHPKKGLENLLAACNILNQTRGQNWQLTIAGTGGRGYIESLEESIRSLCLKNQVSMFGEVIGTAKQALFEQTDLLVVPSFTENFGIVVAESLAHGVPVIASTGTPWKRVEDKGCGLWVPNDPESLARAIGKMSRQPLREMGLRGHQWMREEFSWSPIAQCMIQVYEQVLSRNL